MAGVARGRLHLPPLAYELASNAFDVQAFCHCRHLAVQFHPEVTPAIVAAWAEADHGDLERGGVTPDELDTETARTPRRRRGRPQRCSRLRHPGRARGGSLPHVKHEHTHHVAADADKVYAALADVSNLADYVPQMSRADLHDGDKVTVEARYHGHTQHGEARFRPDDAERRIESGAEGSAYNGWLQVDPDENGPPGSRST